MRVSAWIRGAWRKRQRGVDKEILWPLLLEQAGGDEERAFLGFMAHVQLDPAWDGFELEEVAEELELEEVPCQS